MAIYTAPTPTGGIFSVRGGIYYFLRSNIEVLYSVPLKDLGYHPSTFVNPGRVGNSVNLDPIVELVVAPRSHTKIVPPGRSYSVQVISPTPGDLELYEGPLPANYAPDRLEAYATYSYQEDVYEGEEPDTLEVSLCQPFGSVTNYVVPYTYSSGYEGSIQWYGTDAELKYDAPDSTAYLDTVGVNHLPRVTASSHNVPCSIVDNGGVVNSLWYYLDWQVQYTTSRVGLEVRVNGVLAYYTGWLTPTSANVWLKTSGYMYKSTSFTLAQLAAGPTNIVMKIENLSSSVTCIFEFDYLQLILPIHSRGGCAPIVESALDTLSGDGRFNIFNWLRDRPHRAHDDHLRTQGI